MRKSWLAQIASIENKGYQDFLKGKPLEACPYQEGYRNQNGPGGGLQKQRREAWRRGWELARRESQV